MPGAKQHIPITLAFPERRMGQNSTSDYPETCPRTESMNTGVIMVVSHFIDFWDTFLDDPCRD